MASDSNTRELEWFDLETRMRELLYSQLEPVISKAKEDREQHSIQKIYCRNLEKRLKSLETVVLGDKNAETAIMNLLNRCSDIDGSLKKTIVKFNQEFSKTEEHFKNLEFQLAAQEESVKILLDKKDHADADILKLKSLLDEHKTTVLSEVESLSMSFQDMNKAYVNVAMKTEEKAIEAFHKAHTNSLEMFNYKKEIDNIRKDIVEALTLIREIRGYKVDISAFDQKNEYMMKKFEDLTFELQRQKDEMLKRDDFIEKFIPLQMATMISDYLHYFNDLRVRKRIAEFEDLKLKALNISALESKDTQTLDNRITEILEQMKHVEERKVELLTSDTNANKDKKATRTLKVGEIMFPPNYEETPKGPPGLSKEEVEDVVQKMLTNRLENDFLRFRLEMQKNIQDVNKTLASTSNESQTMDQQILSEIQELQKKIDKNQKNHDDDQSVLAKAYEILKSELKFSVHSLNNLGQMVVCLVENAQIQQALESQDEEDRHNMAYNFERELQSEMAANTPRTIATNLPYKSTIPSANFAFQKKCVSCGTANSILSGFRTSLIYKPTALFYRNKKFERPELIGLKGRILKTCWESTASSLPWKHEAFEKIIKEAARISINTSLDDTERELPTLVTPSTRAKSTNNQRFRFGSLQI
ncbi:hypothetical protein SteCoe_15959 [Stentor coeruleus]|uniref:Uncharacterized protein n=1 Tax=Stentor coeruleus TaxID=5963 RepID=A0A1R2BUA2_9CILI|nr:hypothetical protein SteCoe_19412 [Stentor coeruleus]OMJ83180.1 hypothetical protein SteCoe_15959 [Stentor coeruleus]